MKYRDVLHLEVGGKVISAMAKENKRKTKNVTHARIFHSRYRAVMSRALKATVPEITFVSPNNRVKSNISSQQKKIIKQRDQNICQYCLRNVSEGGIHGENRVLTFDHVIPLIRGGRNHNKNIVVACATCNHSKGHFLCEELGWKTPL